MVSIMARPTNSVRDRNSGRLRLARDRVHRRGNRPAFAQPRADRTEPDRDRGGQDRNRFDAHAHPLSMLPMAAPMKTAASTVKM